MPDEMSQQGDLSQRPSRQDHLVKYPRDALHRHRLARQAVLHRDYEAICALSERSEEAPSSGQMEQAVKSVHRVVIPVRGPLSDTSALV